MTDESTPETAESAAVSDPESVVVPDPVEPAAVAESEPAPEVAAEVGDPVVAADSDGAANAEETAEATAEAADESGDHASTDAADDTSAEGLGEPSYETSYETSEGDLEEDAYVEPEPTQLELIRDRIEIPDDALSEEAEKRQAALIKPPGSMGRLEEVAGWFAAAQGVNPPHDFGRARVVVFAGDHGVAEAGISAYPPVATAQLLTAMRDGGSALSILADAAGASVRLVDIAVDADTPPELSAYKVRRGSRRIDREDALTLEEAQQAFDAGIAIADEEVDSGADLLLAADLGVGNTTPAAVLTAVCLGSEPTAVTGRGSGINDATWMRKVVVVRDALRRGRKYRYETIELLAASGGADIAAMTGFLLQAAVRRTPVVLDGVVSTAAALVARDTAYDAASWWFASHRSTEPAHTAALESLGLEPLLDLGLTYGQGTGGLLALPLLRAAVRTLGEMSTLTEAGVDDTPVQPAPAARRRPRPVAAEPDSVVTTADPEIAAEPESQPASAITTAEPEMAPEPESTPEPEMTTESETAAEPPAAAETDTEMAPPQEDQ